MNFTILPTIMIGLLLRGCISSQQDYPQVRDMETKKTRIIHSEVFIGNINNKFVSNLDEHTKSGDTIIITSSGGEHSASMRAAQIIQNRKLSVYIMDYCMSACAEILLPAAQSIEFIDDPLVGYHWGPMMLSNLLREKAKDKIHLCDFHQEKDITDLYEQTGHNLDFWKVVEKKIQITNWNIILPIQEGCPKPKIISTKNKMWFPTTRELRNGLNLKFQGKLCSDDLECYSKKIRKFWPQPATYIVGDEEFTIE